MIKKYDDNYIYITEITAITRIREAVPNRSIYEFYIHLIGCSVYFEDGNRKRLERLREKIVKDWMEVANDKKYLCTN